MHKTHVFMKKKTIIFTGIIFMLLIVLYFLKSPILRYVLNKKTPSIEQKYGVQIRYSGIKVTRFSNIQVDSLFILHKNSNTSLTANSIEATLPIRYLIKLRTKPKTALQNKKHTNIDSTITSNKILHLLNKLNSSLITLSKPLYGIYTNCTFLCNTLSLHHNKSEAISITTNDFKYFRGNFSSIFRVSTTSNNYHFFAKSKVNPNNHSVSINASFENSYVFPLIQSELGTSVGMDSLHIYIKGSSLKNRDMQLKLQSKIYGLHAQHSKLADSTVFIDSAGLYLSSIHSEQFINIHKPSFAYFNSISIPFCFSAELQTKPKFELTVLDHALEASNIFESIPKGLFKNLENIKVDGNVSLAMNINLDLSQIDSLQILTKLSPQGFRVKQYGITDFRNLNNKFIYTIQVDDSTTKEIALDTLSPTFCRLNKISQHVVNSVIVAEDGGFYHHKGFDADAFSYAISRNIKDKKLARGGSTITMQLVKNLYLNRKKNIARKVEEALIVWLIETQHLVSKERLLEIYFNIIDWGPNINGITEASQFYFQKDPIDIELNEAIFLASIIPRPSYFTSYFDENLELKKHMSAYFENVSSTMLLREMISEEEFANLETSVQLKGRAKEILEFEKITN